MRWARAWLLACRPATLTAAITPVVVGTAVGVGARGAVRVGSAVAALAGAALLQIGANLVNDVADFEKGADRADRLGPVRAVQAGLLSAKSVRWGAATAFGLALLAGTYLAWHGGWPVVIVGILSLAAAITYTAGPWPLGYHGLGDVTVLVFFGVVAVGGTTFVETGRLPSLGLWASLPVGCLAAAILVVNNLRDRENDARAGKRTLAVRLGERGTIAEYAALLAIAYLVPLGLFIAGVARAPILLPLATAPLAIAQLRRVARLRGRALNPLLAGTARLLLWHGLLFGGGIVVGAR